MIEVRERRDTTSAERTIIKERFTGDNIMYVVLYTTENLHNYEITFVNRSLRMNNMFTYSVLRREHKGLQEMTHVIFCFI